MKSCLLYGVGASVGPISEEFINEWVALDADNQKEFRSRLIEELR